MKAAAQAEKLNICISGRDVYPNQGRRTKERTDRAPVCLRGTEEGEEKEKVAVKLLLPQDLQVIREH